MNRWGISAEMEKKNFKPNEKNTRTEGTDSIRNELFHWIYQHTYTAEENNQ